MLVFCIIAAYIAWRLQASRVGRAWNAMREDEQVAEAVGVSSTRYKLLAFAMGGAIGAVGGALFAVQVGSLNNASFTILVSITDARDRDPRRHGQHPRRRRRAPSC